MYNGIGLATPRGSGTNGYVQRNLSAVRKKAPRPALVEVPSAPKPKQPNEALLDHERKREIEVQVLQWAEDSDLFNQGLSEEEVETRLAEKRQELRHHRLDEEKLKRSNETHQYAYAQQQRSDAFLAALRIDPNYVAGSSFDREAQKEKKEQRMQQRIDDEKLELESLDDEQLVELYRHKQSQNKEHRYLYRTEVSPPRSRRSRGESTEGSRDDTARTRDDRDRDSSRRDQGKRRRGSREGEAEGERHKPKDKEDHSSSDEEEKAKASHKKKRSSRHSD